MTSSPASTTTLQYKEKIVTEYRLWALLIPNVTTWEHMYLLFVKACGYIKSLFCWFSFFLLLDHNSTSQLYLNISGE